MVDRTYPSYTYDDDLIEAARADRRTRVRVYRLTEPVAVLGAGGRAEVELDLEACEADSVPILRRRGGGCAVVLDPGNVIVSVAATGLPFGRHARSFKALTAWLTQGLERIGFPGVHQAGICDLAIGDRKIGGACLHRSRDLLYYTTSILVDPDMEKVNRYIKHPPREPDYRRGRSHGDFMGSLAILSNNQSSLETRNSISSPHSTAAVVGAEAGPVARRLRQALQPPILDSVIPQVCKVA